jgi:acylphosphatase
MAAELGIRGFVRNLPDGSVYCEAEGEEADIQLFLDFCGQGSIMSNVTSVDVKMTEPKHFKIFQILN